jgi:hypothetical protein
LAFSSSSSDFSAQHSCILEILLVSFIHAPETRTQKGQVDKKWSMILMNDFSFEDEYFEYFYKISFFEQQFVWIFIYIYIYKYIYLYILYIYTYIVILIFFVRLYYLFYLILFLNVNAKKRFLKWFLNKEKRIKIYRSYLQVK